MSWGGTPQLPYITRVVSSGGGGRGLGVKQQITHSNTVSES